MRVLVTGGAGFLGSNLVRLLLKEGYKVTILDNFTSGSSWNIQDIRDQVRIILGSTFKKEAVYHGVKDADAVIHLAGQVSHITSQKDPMKDVKANVMGTLTILETIRELGKRIPVIYASSRSVYGKKMKKPTDPPITENALPEPLDIYGASKLACEKYGLIYDYHEDIPFIAFRMANLFGPRQILTPIYQFIAWLFFCVWKGREFTFYGDGTQTRDFLYVGDACEAYLMALEKYDKLRGQVYNLNGKTYCTWNEAMAIAKEVTGGEIKVKYIPHTTIRAKLENPYSRLSGDKIARAVGWRPKTTLKEGFEKMLEYYSKNDNWKHHLLHPLNQIPKEP